MEAKSPGVITRIGLNFTFVDPRLEGGVSPARQATPTSVKEIVIEGERHLLYPAPNGLT